MYVISEVMHCHQNEDGQQVTSQEISEITNHTRLTDHVVLDVTNGVPRAPSRLENLFKDMDKPKGLSIYHGTSF